MGFNYLFIFLPSYVAFWGSKAHHRFTGEGVSWCLETSLFFKTPFLGRISIPASFVSFTSFIFFLTSLRIQWPAFLGARCPLPAFRSCSVEFTQRSNVLLMNLWERKWSSHPILGPLPLLCFNETLLHRSSEQLSLVTGPGLNFSPPEAKNPASLRGSVTTCHLGGSSGILQDKVRMLGALYSPSKYIFWCTLLTLWCSCMDEWNALCGASEEPCSAVPQWPHTPYSRNLLGVYTDLPMPRNTQCLLWWPIRNGQSMWTELSQSNILVPLTIS